jgi:chemotaxis protein MotB
VSRRSHSRREPAENHERWLVSYADFITLLFAFFIVLYATSERNAEKTKSFQESVQKFLVRVGAATGAGAGADANVNEATKNNSPIEPPLPTFKTSSDLAGEVMAEVELAAEENLSEQDRKTFGLDLSHDSFGVRISLAANSIFANNDILFEKSALKTLDVIAFILNKMDYRVVVESHVDQVEGRAKPYDTDWKLSAARSAQVVQYFVSRHQMDPQRFVALGHGSQRPIFPHDDKEKAPQNQRLDLLIVTEESPF